MDQAERFDVDQATQLFLAWRQWHSTSPPEDQLAEWRVFFSNWERLVPPKGTSEESPSLDCERFDSFGKAFGNPYEEYRRSGAMVNVWRAAGLKHDELPNSQVLSWILDKFGDHGQGSVILERLVELLSNQMVGVSAAKVRTNNYWTRTEQLPLGDLESRVDIEIESSAFLIFIEVKVRAPETGDQLQRYVDLAPKKAAGRPWSIIYLTTNGRKPDSVDLHGKVIPLSWRQIANILDAHTSGATGNTFSGRIFRQFADHARYLV